MADLRMPPMREAFNVDDLKRRDKLVRRHRKLRAQIVQIKAEIEADNAANPNDPPMSTEFEDGMLDFLDGKADFPSKLAMRIAQEAHAGKIARAVSGGEKE